MTYRIPNKKLLVGLAGNIGAGKTTAATLISQTFGFDLFCEPVIENRFLKDYYADMKRWSFTLQLEFLIKRVEHLESIGKKNVSCVQDRTLTEDPEVFARYLHGLGNLDSRELNLYLEYFDLISKRAPKPDKVILLSVPDENVLLERIKSRGRPEELSMPVEFLAGLNKYYNKFQASCPNLDILELDVTKIDIRAGEGQAMFLDKVDGFLNG